MIRINAGINVKLLTDQHLLADDWIKEETGRTSNVVSQIKDCILERQKTAFGYKWKYKENV